MMDAYSSVGMPVGYQHWSYCKEFVAVENRYRRGQMGLAYELVINSNPCTAYLMEENSMTMQALVIAHACWPWVQPMVGVAFRRTNVYLSPDIYAITLPGRDDFALAARTYLQDRFLFASGYPFAPIGGAVQAYRALGFSCQVAEKIFRKNAAALLGRPAP